MPRASLAAEIAAVRALSAALGLGEVAPRLLKAAHHTILLVAPHRLVARVQSAEPDAHARAQREIAVARHLAARGAPALAPLSAGLAGPHATAAGVVTLWPYVAASGEADAAMAAQTLHRLHAALRDYPGDLPPLSDALDRCAAALHRADFTPADRALLTGRLALLRPAVDVPGVPLHGDAHLGNLLVGDAGALWIDFEEACRGPREWDIASLPPAAWRRFPDADRRLLAACAELRSVTVAVHCAAELSRSSEMGEAAAYHIARIRRFAGP